MPDSASNDDNVIPLHGKVSDAEWETRLNLAAAFRAAHHYGWNDTVRNHITALIPGSDDEFLMNPLGLGWHEITASSLVKTNFAGDVLSGGDVKLAPAGFNFHSEILKSLPEIVCVLHVHEMAGTAVSATEEGLIMFDQGGCMLHGEVGYHDFEGLASEAEEAPRIVADLSDRHALIMRNHGLLTVGRTIGEAFTFMHGLVTACRTQVQLLSMGVPIRRLPEDICVHTHEQMMGQRGNKPIGERDWPMYYRIAEGRNPSFKD